MSELQTFTFEGHYRESDGGNRCDIVLAYNRDQALAIAGRQLVEDNGWDGPKWGWPADQFATYAGFADLYTSEVKIDSEWTDLKGSACPNCTSHGGKVVEATQRGIIMGCSACGYQWMPLGFGDDRTSPTSEQLDAELAEAWAKLIKEEEDVE